MGKRGYQDYVNTHVLDMNQWIKQFASENDLITLDFQPLLSDENGIRKKEYATPDGSHISSAGYDKLSRYAQEVLTYSVSVQFGQNIR